MTKWIWNLIAKFFFYFRIFQCHQWMEAAPLPWADRANQWTGWDPWADPRTITWTGTTQCTSTGAGLPLRGWCPTGWEVTPWARPTAWWVAECLLTRSHLAPAAAAVTAPWVPGRWRHRILRPEVTWHRPPVRRWRRCRRCRRRRVRCLRWFRERRTNERRTFVKCTIWFVKEVEDSEKVSVSVVFKEKKTETIFFTFWKDKKTRKKICWFVDTKKIWKFSLRLKILKH